MLRNEVNSTSCSPTTWPHELNRYSTEVKILYSPRVHSLKAPIHVQLNCTVNCANHNCTVNCANHNCTVMAPPIHAQLNCTVNCANRLVFTQSTAQLQPDTVEWSSPWPLPWVPRNWKILLLQLLHFIINRKTPRKGKRGKFGQRIGCWIEINIQNCWRSWGCSQKSGLITSGWIKKHTSNCCQ